MTMTAMLRQGKNKVKWTRFRDDAFGHECTCGQRSLVSWLRLIRVGVSTAQNFAMRIESQGSSHEAGIAALMEAALAITRMTNAEVSIYNKARRYYSALAGLDASNS